MYEAVVNSLDANAKHISIKFEVEIIKKGNKDLPLIKGFQVIDDGDGFNEKNTESFFEMMKMDKEKGKLGSGRFIWLKVFDTVEIKSTLVNRTVEINFVKNYDEIVSKEEKAKNSTNRTVISFKNVTPDYIEEMPEYDIDKMEKEITDQLLPKLLLFNQSKKFVEINIDDKRIIKNDNLPAINKETFEVKRNNTKADFTLYYDIKKDGKGIVSTYYVAHGRQVREFTSEAKLPKLPEKASVIMFLVSDYFNDHIGDDRNDFDIDIINTTPDSPLSFNDINKKLIEFTNKILNETLPEIKTINEEAKKKAIEAAPHLAKYINSDTENIRTESEWGNFAKSELEKEEKQIRKDFKKILGNKKISNEEYNRIISDIKRMGEVELGRYIAYRQQIINHLLQLEQASSTSEEQLHDVFIEYLDKTKKHNKNKKQTFDKYVDTNLWLLDDKFMFYKEVFSDESIKNIKSVITKENTYYSLNNCEPDITIFYNKQHNKYKDVVVVEFKAIGMVSDEARRKSVSTEEINTNIAVIKKEIPEINNYYGFIITRFDDKTIERLVANDAQMLYSQGDVPYFYIYNKNNNAHTYFVDIRSVINDAHSRNQVFLDILTQRN